MLFSSGIKVKVDKIFYVLVAEPPLKIWRVRLKQFCLKELFF